MLPKSSRRLSMPGSGIAASSTPELSPFGVGPLAWLVELEVVRDPTRDRKELRAIRQVVEELNVYSVAGAAPPSSHSVATPAKVAARHIQRIVFDLRIISFSSRLCCGPLSGDSCARTLHARKQG